MWIKTLSLKTIRAQFCWKQTVRKVQTRTLNIRYFFITDQVEKGKAQIEHCGTDNMVGDFLQSLCKAKEVPKISEQYPWTSDVDHNEEEEGNEQEGQVEEPVGQTERPQHKPPRPKYILMDYDKSMGDGVIPDNKVLRPKNCWCYTILDPVFWEENTLDRCPTYGVCRVWCGSGPTGRYCQICKN
jgi:hypothetical protein